MQSNSVWIGVVGLALAVCSGAWAQPAAGASWTLPHDLAVSEVGVRTFRFTVDYQTNNQQGAVVRRQRLSGEYVRGLVGGEVQWKNVRQFDANGANGPFEAAKGRDFMEGFRYKNDLGATMQPEFFKSFPATAVFERNLVWDTGMIELFGQQYFDKLKLNQPHQAMSEQSVQLPGLGSFHNRNVLLEWVGMSLRNGQNCALIDYRAFGNPLDISAGGMTLRARSDYWGQIWVSLKSKQIEYATLYENVSGEFKLPGQDSPQPLSVFRIGTFEPVAGL